MSARIALLRDALMLAVKVIEQGRDANFNERVQAAAKAQAALAATGFVAPETYPFAVGTRSGALVTLHGRHNDRLIGSWIDRDGLQLNDWALDGTQFGADDPDDFDLIMPEEAPIAAFLVPA